MKRDMDLCRSILLDLEAQTPDLTDSNFGFDHEQAATRVSAASEIYDAHLNLLYQAGFIEGWANAAKYDRPSPKRERRSFTHTLPS